MPTINRPVVNYVTNLPLEEISGGISGMNRAAHDALAGFAELPYIGPVNPPVTLTAKVISKATRLLGGKGRFYFYSEERLRRIATEVSARSHRNAALDFYHGFTPWILCSPPRPYAAWNDCTFADYIDIYHDPRDFAEADLERIRNCEVNWLAGAELVIFSSEWARDRAAARYGLANDRLRSVGIFGAMEPPQLDTWSGGQDFYFISTDYRRKNGTLCRRAIELVWETFPEARLRIIGAPPPAEDLVPGRVIYEGFFRKSIPAELEQFREHLRGAFALLHPTDADTTAMILIEAAFFGCPAISVNDFAIPEVIGPAGEGMLLDRPIEASALAGKMAALLQDKEGYHARRARVRASALARHRPEQFRERLRDAVADITGWTTGGGKR
jgi:glycosyltransferase involved in cell wall biosynthesis